VKLADYGGATAPTTIQMTCYKCGSPSQPDQKFCRSCGASLQLATQRLAPLSELENTATTNSEDEQHSPNRLAMLGLIVMFIGAAIGVVGKKLLYQDVVTVVGILISLLGMFLTVYPVLVPARPRRISSNPKSRTKTLASQEPPRRLPHASNLEFIPSVTERTTSLLENAPGPNSTSSRSMRDEGEEAPPKKE
jgi:hypothetical protein